MRSPGEIVSQIKLGGDKASREEIEAIRVCFKDGSIGSGIYNCSRALALSCDPNESDISILERYLSKDADEWDLQGIIYSLFDYWNLAYQYVDFFY